VSDAIVKSLGGEWESLADEVNSQGVLRNMAHDEVKFDLRVQRTLLKDKLPDDATDEMVVREAWHDIKEKLNIEIEKVRAFEDNIFSGPMAFLLGLYHFLRSDGGEKYRLIGRDVAHQLDSAVSFWLGTETLDLGIDEKDKRSPGLRWRQDSLIFKPYDVIRFAEPQLDELLSVCTERPS
jgi:hypothetical protein